MPAPTTTTEWATNDINDPTNGDNKVAITTALKDNGLDPLESFARPYLNYQFNSIDQHIRYIIDDLLGTGTESVLQKVFPVGSYYMSGTVSANPSVALGFGTWLAVEGKFIVGLDTGDTDFDTLLETGGSKTLTGSTDGHSLTAAENGPHTHNITLNLATVDDPNQRIVYAPDNESGTDSETTDSSGSGTAHSHTLSADHLQPYETAAIWRRVS